jgi:hypothetical protein
LEITSRRCWCALREVVPVVRERMSAIAETLVMK